MFRVIAGIFCLLFRLCFPMIMAYSLRTCDQQFFAEAKTSVLQKILIFDPRHSP